MSRDCFFLIPKKNRNASRAFILTIWPTTTNIFILYTNIFAWNIIREMKWRRRFSRPYLMTDNRKVNIVGTFHPPETISVSALVNSSVMELLPSTSTHNKPQTIFTPASCFRAERGTHRNLQSKQSRNL